MQRFAFVALAFAVFASSPALAQNKKVPFLTPDKAIAKMKYPEGFRVTAFAAEPDVVQPFAFCFDERGRLWVAENLNYLTRGSDSFKDGPKGRIAILEDTDGDGIFNKRKVFAEKIFFPSGLAVGFGGVYVGSPPNLLFIPDADRDDRPDGEPRVLLDGWGRHDRHETLNSFIWGPDGWLYGCHGVFTHSNVGKPGAPDSERARINAGVWRYHPTKDKFEVFAWGTSNPWGLDFDDHGQAFITACVIPHLWHMIQGGRYHRQGGRHFNPHVYNDIKTIADHRHASAHGGARFYLADAFPEKYRKRLFMCNIHQHDILTDVLERRGSGFVGKHGDQFLASNDPQWLGFNMEIGPEGAVYVIDWHDQDICGRRVHHEETGRIWRVAYGDKKSPVGFDLAKKTDAELVEMQLHANDWYVRQARRLLQERAIAGKLAGSTHAALAKMLDTHPEVPRLLRALWTLHATGGLTDAIATRLLDDKSEYLRALAIQLISENETPEDAILAKFATMAKKDPSPFVWLYLASACQRLPIEKRWDILEGIAAHADVEGDHNLPLMIWYALEPGAAVDAKRALSIAKSCPAKQLTRYVTRRITATALSRKRETRKSEATKIKPAASVSSKGLALWLRSDFGVGEEGGIVDRWLDRSGSGRDAKQGSKSSRPKLVPNLKGRPAIRFDGEDDSLVVAHDKDITFAAKDSYSMSAWVYYEGSQGGWRTIVAKSRDKKPWYGIWVDPGQRWIFGGDNDNLAGPKASQGWHHICVVQEGDGAKLLYVDGALAGDSQAIDSNGTGDLWIGAARSVQEHFRGGVSEIRLYRRALSHPEVLHLAKNP